VKHRPSTVGNDIAANRISSKPQELQAILATVKIGRGSWRKVVQADRKNWLPCRGPIVEEGGIQVAWRASIVVNLTGKIKASGARPVLASELDSVPADLHDTGRLAACRTQVDPLQKYLGLYILGLL